MASTVHSYLTYNELYGEPANNTFGNVESRQLTWYRAVYEMWRATGLPPKVEKIHQNILAECSRTIGGISVFVADLEFGRQNIVNPAFGS
jgi:hypothetical protein